MNTAVHVSYWSKAYSSNPCWSFQCNAFFCIVFDTLQIVKMSRGTSAIKLITLHWQLLNLTAFKSLDFLTEKIYNGSNTFKACL